jgi:hypothetical protein
MTMKGDLNKWQGIEQEFRIGISSIQTYRFRKSLSCKSQVQPQKVHEYAIWIFNALKVSNQHKITPINYFSVFFTTQNLLEIF